MGIMPEALMASTGITGEDGSVRLDIRGHCGFAVHISELGWKKLQAEEEFTSFVSLISQQDISLSELNMDFGSTTSNERKVVSPSETVNNTLEDASRGGLEQNIDSRAHKSSDATHDTTDTNATGKPSSTYESESSRSVTNRTFHEDLHVATPDHTAKFDVDLATPSRVLERAFYAMRQAEVSKSVDCASFVYFTDTGGQPEFQELLPLLIAACNLVYIVFNLEHNLDSCPPLQYLPSISEPAIEYQSPYTVGEMLSKSLLSVPVSTTSKYDESDPLNSSSIFFIGTHKDKVSADEITAANKQLLQVIQDTPQYQCHMVQRCSSESIIFPVNNFSSLENDKDFEPIRRGTQSLVYGKNSFKVKAPSSWLFLGIVLQKYSGSHPIISLEHCKKISTQCGLEDKDIQPCLKFLHSKIGAIKYYNTKNLCNVVFLKPQLVINLISQVMRGAFKKPEALRAVMDEHDIQEVVKDSKIMPPQLMHLLMKDLLMSAPHPKSTAQHSLHYLTCMLPIEKNAHDPAAVLFSLKGFVLPTGIGRSILTSILQNQMQAHCSYKINYQKVFQNSLEFIGGNDNITFNLSYCKQYLQLSVLSKMKANTSTRQVRMCIEEIMTNVLKLYNCKANAVPIISFFCRDCDFETIPRHFTTLTSNGTLQCSRTKKLSPIPKNLNHFFRVSVFVVFVEVALRHVKYAPTHQHPKQANKTFLKAFNSDHL